MDDSLQSVLRTKTARVASLNPVRASGMITDFVGLLIESQGPPVSVGDLCDVETSDGAFIRAQVVGFRANRVLSMPLEETGGLRLGGAIVARREAGQDEDRMSVAARRQAQRRQTLPEKPELQQGSAFESQ